MPPKWKSSALTALLAAALAFLLIQAWLPPGPEARALRASKDYLAFNLAALESAGQRPAMSEDDRAKLNYLQRFEDLEPKAYGLLPYIEGKRAGWTVLFLYKKGSEAAGRGGEKGLAISMDPGFQDLHVALEDFDWNAAQKNFDP